MPKRKKAQPRPYTRWKKLYDAQVKENARLQQEHDDASAATWLMNDLASQVFGLIKNDIESMIDEQLDELTVTKHA